MRDLRSNIAAEAGALNTYEQLIAMTTDDGTRDALTHLATREVSHTHMFMEALRSMNALEEPLFGNLKPDNTVNLTSTSRLVPVRKSGDHGTVSRRFSM